MERDRNMEDWNHKIGKLGKLTALFLVGLKQSGQVFALPKERHICVNQEVTSFGPILHDGKFTFMH